MSVQARRRVTEHWRAAAWCGAAFLGLLLLVALGWLRGFDEGVGAAAKASTPCWIRNSSEAASVLLAGEVSLVYALVLGGFCAWRGHPWAGVAVVGLMLCAVAVEFLLKFVLFQPSPGIVLADVEAVQCVPVGYPLTSISPNVVPNTLPSGYATRAAYFGILLAGLAGAYRPGLRRAVWPALAAILALLAASRVAIVWHWTTDVVAGLLLGSAVACVALALADGFRWLTATRRP